MYASTQTDLERKCGNFTEVNFCQLKTAKLNLYICFIYCFPFQRDWTCYILKSTACLIGKRPK